MGVFRSFLSKAVIKIVWISINHVFAEMSSISCSFSRWLGKNQNPLVNAGEVGFIPGFESFPGGGNGNPLEYSCLENPQDRGAWQAPLHHKELHMTEHACLFLVAVFVLFFFFFFFCIIILKEYSYDYFSSSVTF